MSISELFETGFIVNKIPNEIESNQTRKEESSNHREDYLFSNEDTQSDIILDPRHISGDSNEVMKRKARDGEKSEFQGKQMFLELVKSCLRSSLSLIRDVDDVENRRTERCEIILSYLCKGKMKR
ncbi:hypothetical protein MHBO_005133 [Bonamia ostreae]|uniref:Uncharacterized protein n=1 Tax=Bonamia ostreae TaxID=126728 RepID=A0ABV2AV75_9EUKA